MLDLTYQHQATTQLYVQALIGIFFWLALRDISIYADMTLAAIIYLGMLTLIRQILTRRFRLYAYGCQAFGVQRQDLVIHPGDPGLVFLHKLRFKRAITIARSA
ncbi:TPA: hypothetical protein GF206_17865 [Escherichia coli]|nr:hypothetical protein [Escherichia coli]EFE6876416.1 hypothetical protein [Escherichia coli]EFF5688933.1 hypothetical protein [Escherichia coli]EFI9015961.1 hypothetical protein [Escherichia coli]MCI5240400.1 hypothetical protein [Escherichia coli]